MLIRIVPCLLAILFFANAALSQDKANPIETMVKANLKDPSKPFVMFIHIKIKDGMTDKFEAAFAKARIETRKEKGNRAYSLSRSTKTPTEYVIHEEWNNFEALQAHMKLPHFTSLLMEVHEMFDGPPDVRVYLPARE